MHDKRYDTITTTKSRIDPCADGLYSEMLVENTLNKSIVAIDRHGNRHLIEPIKGSMGSRGVVITKRSQNGRRVNRNSVEVPLPAMLITVPDWQLTQGPIYVEEVDLLICSEQHAHAAEHPYRSNVYIGALETATNQLCNQDYFATFRMYANDPEGKIKMLYISFLGKLIEVPVTKIRSTTATFTVAITSKRSVLHRWVCSMEDVIKAEGCLEDMVSGTTLYVGLTPDSVISAVDADSKKTSISHETLQKQVKAVEDQHKLQTKSLTDKYKLEVEELANKVKRKEIEIDNVKDDLDTVQIERDQLRKLLNVDAEKNKLDHQRQQEEEKTKRARIAATHEETKFKSYVVKTIAGVAISAGTLLIKFLIDRAKDG